MVSAAVFFAILLASPILNANAYAAGGFSSLYLRQLSFHDSSLDKRQASVCENPGYSPCPDGITCCPTGSTCLVNRQCDIPCTATDIPCGVGCCFVSQFCGSDDLCYEGTPPPSLPPPPTPVTSTAFRPPLPSFTSVTLPPLFPSASSSSSSTTTSVLATAFVQTTATPGATAPPSAASGAPIGCMRSPSLLLLAIVIAHLGFFAGYGVF